MVNSGLLTMASNQDQLAAVLGHELAHVTARHANERASRSALTDVGVDIASIILGGGYRNQTQGARNALSTGALLGILNPFSRLQESEADTIGLEYMSKSGFDPRESVVLCKKMNSKNTTRIPEYLSTHPSGETRIDELISQLPNTLNVFNIVFGIHKHNSLMEPGFPMSPLGPGGPGGPLCPRGPLAAPPRPKKSTDMSFYFR